MNKLSAPTSRCEPQPTNAVPQSPSRTALRSSILIATTLLSSWLGMQVVHESGHVLGALLTGASVTRVVVHPLTISRTDLGHNPHPVFVIWAGPVWGCLAPCAAWWLGRRVRLSALFLLRFFAGFCLLSNGVYLGVGAFEGIGDCGDLLRHGVPIWQLWLFGAPTTLLGLWVWHGLGPHFGLGPQPHPISVRTTFSMCGVFIALAAFGYLWGFVNP